MKIEVKENDGNFSLSLEAENMSDAAFLSRFGLNRTRQLISCYAWAWADGKFTGQIVFGKDKRLAGNIERKR